MKKSIATPPSTPTRVRSLAPIACAQVVGGTADVAAEPDAQSSAETTKDGTMIIRKVPG